MKLLKSLAASLILAGAASHALAGEWRRIYPNIVWERWEWNGTDWVMEYRIPRGFHFDSLSPIGYRSYVLTNVTLGFNGLSTGDPNWVTLTAGARARYLAAYWYGARFNGIRDWANETAIWIYKP